MNMSEFPNRDTEDEELFQLESNSTTKHISSNCGVLSETECNSTDDYLSPVSLSDENNDPSCVFVRVPISKLMYNENANLLHQNTDLILEPPKPCSCKDQSKHYETVCVQVPKLTGKAKTNNCCKTRSSLYILYQIKYITLLSLILNVCLLVVLICIFILGLERGNPPPGDPTEYPPRSIGDKVPASSVCLECEHFRKRYTNLTVRLEDQNILCCMSKVSHLQLLLKIMLIRLKNDNRRTSKNNRAVAAHVYLNSPGIQNGQTSEITHFSYKQFAPFGNTYGINTIEDTYLRVAESGLYCIYLFSNIKMSDEETQADPEVKKDKVTIFVMRKTVSKSSETLASTSIYKTPSIYGGNSHQNGSLLTFANLSSGDMIYSMVSDKSIIYDFTECNFMGMFQVE